MAKKVLDDGGLAQADRDEATAAWQAYQATWPTDQQPTAGQPAASTTGQQDEREWKFHAAQLTYNCKEGD
eukprot:8906895-Karenia_brevis.AAC.1